MYESLEKLIAAVVMSIMGSISTWLISGATTWRTLLTTLFLGGFMGLLVYEACLSYKLDGPTTAIFCGMGGLISDISVRFLRKLALQKMGWLFQTDVNEELAQEQNKVAPAASVVAPAASVAAPAASVAAPAASVAAPSSASTTSHPI